MTTFWHRVEPSGRDDDLEEGVQARVADPLWMLARQWQLGEFRGEDAASPIHARVVVESSPVRSFRNRAGGDRVEPFAGPRPLECRVEAERTVDGPAAIALAADSGLRFLRRLDAAGLGAVRSAVEWRDAFALELTAVELAALPATTRRRLALLARRAVDGRKLAAASDAVLAALVEAAAPGTWSATQAVVTAWRAADAGHVVEPAPDRDCWNDERLSYDFSLGVPHEHGELTLTAADHPGGHLDWYAFRLGQAAPLASPPRTPAPTVKPLRVQRELLPTPVTYRGQPVPRWWEFEERTVYLGGIAAGPADLARLIVAEFGTVFSDDWFVIPVELPVASLNRVTALEVRDVFGGVHHLAATAVNDHVAHGAARPWACFELDGDRSAAQRMAPFLFLAPALASSLGGEPVEHVTLVRDEAANLGWAIEHVIEQPTGEPLRRRQLWQPAPTEEPPETWRYRLQTPVPPWWVPLVPERVGDTTQVRLRRGRMQSWQEQDPALVGAKGRVIGMARALRLYEEVVPRGGVQITRAWQLARGSDGSIHLWVARHKRPGRGDRASGLRFDEIEG